MIRILLSTRLGERRMNQAELARATGIRPNTINELYHELAERVTLEHLDLICEALNCKLECVFSYFISSWVISYHLMIQTTDTFNHIRKEIAMPHNEKQKSGL